MTRIAALLGPETSMTSAPASRGMFWNCSTGTVLGRRWPVKTKETHDRNRRLLHKSRLLADPHLDLFERRPIWCKEHSARCMNIIADPRNDADPRVRQACLVDFGVALDHFLRRFDAVPPWVKRVIADNVDMHHQTSAFQGVADRVDVSLSVVFPCNEGMVNLANLVGAPLPRGEAIQRLLDR